MTKVIVASKKSTTGSERKGVRASDFLAQVVDPIAQSPLVEKSREIIETLRINEAAEHKLTAQSFALNELLYAHARNNGIAEPSHQIEMKTCMKYLDVVHADRVIDHLDRIMKASVKYDIKTESGRHVGWLRFLDYTYEEDLKAGTAIITYELPRVIHEHILGSTNYGYVELNAISKFTCKYSSRLYSRLAYRAGMNHGFNRTWEISPTELAASLDFPMKDGKLHYGVFLRDCLTPALDDIRNAVRRFTVKMTEKRGSGRGRPVEKLVFKISELNRSFKELPAKQVSAATFMDIRDDQSGELPSALAVGRACKLFDMSERQIISLWQAFIAHHRPILSYALELMRLEGFIIKKLDKEGPDAAFEQWVEWHQIQKSKPSTVFELHTPEETTPAAAPVAKPVLKFGFETPKLPVPKPAVVEEPEPSSEDIIMKPKMEPMRVESIQRDAGIILRALRNECLNTGKPKTYEDGYFYMYLDVEMPPWCWLLQSDEQRRNLSSALRALRKTNSKVMRYTLKALATAASDWDLDKIDGISKAVYAKSQAGELPAGNIKEARGPNNGTNSTQQITELATEYDFSDPAYGHSVSFDDIDHPDANNV